MACEMFTGPVRGLSNEPHDQNETKIDRAFLKLFLKGFMKKTR